jgi:hypothetical protein
VSPCLHFPARLDQVSIVDANVCGGMPATVLWVIARVTEKDVLEIAYQMVGVMELGYVHGEDVFLARKGANAEPIEQYI